MIQVIASKCPQDHICPMIRVCPKKAITQKGFNAPEINHKECIECMACVNRCPYKVFEKH